MRAAEDSGTAQILWNYSTSLKVLNDFDFHIKASSAAEITIWKDIGIFYLILLGHEKVVWNNVVWKSTTKWRKADKKTTCKKNSIMNLNIENAIVSHGTRKDSFDVAYISLM